MNTYKILNKKYIIFIAAFSRSIGLQMKEKQFLMYMENLLKVVAFFVAVIKYDFVREKLSSRPNIIMLITWYTFLLLALYGFI